MVQELSSSFPPRVALVTGGLKLGGATTFLCNLGGELVRRGIPAAVLSFERETPVTTDFERLRIPVLWQDDRRVIFEDRLEAVLHELGQFKPTTVVSCLGAISFEVLRYLPPGVFRVGMVQSHDPGVYTMVRRYAAYLDLIAGVSKAAEGTLKTMPEFARVPTCYLPYGVPMPEKTMPSRSDPGAPLRILYLGRLDQEQKRVRLFPQILEQLKSAGIPFHWTVAGEGPEKSFLQSAMRSPSQEQAVSFPGAILYRDVPQVLATHDVFILASDYEGLPLSLLEAMGYGLVPVVSDLASGVREVVDESTGKRVAPDNTPGYGEAVIWLHHHRDEMSRLSQNAQAKVRREFSIGAMTDRWLKVLPSSPPSNVNWPAVWSVRAPLASRNGLRFSVPGRFLRRWLVKRRSGGFKVALLWS